MRFAARTLLGAGLALLLASAASGAEEWNQEQATALAETFETKVSDLYQKARVESREPSLTQRADSYLIVDDLRSLRNHSRTLKRSLSEGQGLDDTSRLFTRIVLLVRELRDQRVSTPILEDAQAEIDQARAALEGLAAFYGEALPPVAAPATRPAAPKIEK